MIDAIELAKLKSELERTRIDACDGNPPAWLLLGSRRHAIEPDSTAWRDLDDWMSWFVDAYEVECPTCWRDHHGLVQEIVAFRCDHNGILTGTAHELVVWHEYLDHLLNRIHDLGQRCYGGKKHTLKGPAATARSEMVRATKAAD